MDGTLPGIFERGRDCGLDLASRAGHRPAVQEQCDVACAAAQLAGERRDLVADPGSEQNAAEAQRLQPAGVWCVGQSGPDLVGAASQVGAAQIASGGHAVASGRGVQVWTASNSERYAA